MNSQSKATPDAATLLADLIRCPSVTPNEAGTLTYIADLLDRVGFVVDRLTFSAPNTPDDPTHGTDALDRGLREDLSSTGATRSLRALRVVQRLALTRHAPMLFVMIWRHDPWTVDGPLLAGQSVALRSLTVKAYALRALAELPARQ